MKFISPGMHGALDYAVAIVLIGAPFLLGFSNVSVAAAAISAVAGVGLFVYSLLTDYSAGLRAVIPFRVHLALDAMAATAFLVVPALIGFSGVPRVFYLVVGCSVLAVVACSRVGETMKRPNPTLRRSGSTLLPLGIAAAVAGLSALLTPTSPLRAAGAAANLAQFTAGGQLIRPKGWREWIYVGTPLTPNSLNPPEAAFPEFHSVYIDPESWEHYKRTGEFRDGTMIAKELVSVGETQATSGKGFFMGQPIGFEIAYKSTERFPQDPGHWAYFSFGHKPEPYDATAAKQPVANCATCHFASAAQDNVFIQYYPVLRAVRAR